MRDDLMCSEKTIADIDSGKSVVLKKSWMYFLGLFISSGVIAWLFTVIFWITGTDNNIAKNDRNISLNKTELLKINRWKENHTDKHDELIYNLARLMEVNGIEWKLLKK